MNPPTAQEAREAARSLYNSPFSNFESDKSVLPSLANDYLLLERYIDHAEKRIEELEKRGWQPIATAPKDGTKIDLLIDGKRFADCWWHESDRFDYVKGWYKEGLNPLEELRFLRCQPTHWMPIPRPPEGGES